MMNHYKPKTSISIKKKRIGVFGGAFNPIHYGHIALAAEVKKYINYDTFMFVPTFQASHKEIECDFNHRCEMVNLCIDSDSISMVSPIEKFLGRPTITINLIMALLWSQTESVNIDLIIGFDQFIDFQTWDNWNVLIENCRLVVVNRGIPGLYNEDEIEKMCMKLYTQDCGDRLIRKNGNLEYGSDKIFILNNHNIDIPEMSSTKVRGMIKNNESIERFVTSKVIDYIKTNKLYR